MKAAAALVTGLALTTLLLVGSADALPRCPGGSSGSIGVGGLIVKGECPAPKPPPQEPFQPINEPPRPDPCATLVDRGNGLPVLIGQCLTTSLVLPVPPAPGSVFAQVPIPTTQVKTSPTERNLVGRRTDFWYTDPGTIVAQVSLTDANGFAWVGEARAEVVRYTWRVGMDYDKDGREDSRWANHPGSEAEPSAHYVYQRNCRCTLTVVATWSGTYTLTEATTGTTYTNVSLGEHDFAVTAPYQAIEVEAIITE